MIRPVFILCSESGTVDKFTNLVSIHNIIERLTLHQGQGDGVKIGGSPIIKLRAIARWDSEEEESFDCFHQFVVQFPNKDVELDETPFVARGQPARFICEFTLPHGSDEPTANGMITVTSRIRKRGEDNWQSQSYRIPLILSHATSTKSESEEKADN